MITREQALEALNYLHEVHGFEEDYEPLATLRQYIEQGSQLGADVVPPEILAIGQRLHTQDNRITQDPLFAVQQKRRIYGVDIDYTSNFEWCLDGEKWTPEPGEKPPEDVRRVGYIDIWEFVTGCFTEQGCKDYIARNGHNLHSPRIYAYGSYRNDEFIGLRKWLMGLSAAPQPQQEQSNG